MIKMLLKLIFGGLFKRNTSEAKQFKKFSKEAQMQMLRDYNEKT
jgi:hypothetical protein